MSIEIRVPTLGESITEATVGNWYKSTGDVVEQDEVVCDLDTEKVAIEVRAPKGGILSEIVADKGEDVSVDALLATLSEGIPKELPTCCSKGKNHQGSRTPTRGSVPKGESTGRCTIRQKDNG